MRLRLLKLAALALTSDNGRKTIGWVLAAVFSPLILIVILTLMKKFSNLA